MIMMMTMNIPFNHKSYVQKFQLLFIDLLRFYKKLKKHELGNRKNGVR